MCANSSAPMLSHTISKPSSGLTALLLQRHNDERLLKLVPENLLDPLPAVRVYTLEAPCWRYRTSASREPPGGRVSHRSSKRPRSCTECAADLCMHSLTVATIAMERRVPSVPVRVRDRCSSIKLMFVKESMATSSALSLSARSTATSTATSLAGWPPSSHCCSEPHSVSAHCSAAVFSSAMQLAEYSARPPVEPAILQYSA
mmetsp:Transcript_38971/g.109398  ORF Transcript_38971/g.109398 Transcript_38971/m.109398 type:complete len:202 (+) Transcript_38971:311-916(+)